MPLLQKLCAIAKCFNSACSQALVKFTTTTMRTAIGAAGIAAVSLATAGSAAAAPNIQGFGTSEPLIDGPMVTNYTVSNLQPSTIAIPGFTPKGTLYFDATGAPPNGVVYNDGLQDILMWTSNIPSASNTPGASQNMPAPGEPDSTGPALGALPAPTTT